jgi:hypothetical protein
LGLSGTEHIVTWVRTLERKEAEGERKEGRGENKGEEEE